MVRMKERSDIPALWQIDRKAAQTGLLEFGTHLLARLGADAPRKSLSPCALQALEQHDWPGNVRELAHVLERAVILAGDTPEITAAHIRCRRRSRA